MSDKIDRIVTNRFLALPIFALVMFLVYFISVSTVGSWATDWTNDMLFGEWIIPGVDNALNAVGCAQWLSGLIVDGVIGGVGAVLGFVPQMLVLFLLLAFLESCGYMARIAFVLDRIFRRFGLSGKSFIPMLIGTGCGVPGIMASSFTPLSAYSFLVFNLLCAPCFAAIGAIKREMNSVKWTWFAIGYQTAFAYAVSFVIYQIGSAFVGDANVLGTVTAVIILAVFCCLLFKPNKQSTRGI